jgi:hypothetical protein
VRGSDVRFDTKKLNEFEKCASKLQISISHCETFVNKFSYGSLERNAWNKLHMLSGVPMSMMTTAAEKFNTTVELNYRMSSECS